MKRERLLAVVFVALTLGFFACQKDNSNSSFKGNSVLGIKMQALNTNFSLPVSTVVGTKSASIGSSSIAWDTIQMVVSNLKFEAKLKSLISHHDSIEISYKWTGPMKINLLDTNITVGNFTLQPGFYDEIEIKVNGLKQDAGVKPVFYLHGMYTKDITTSLPVMVKVNQDVMFKTEKDSVEVTVKDNPGFTSYIQLYLDQLMAQIQPVALDNATLSNGEIVISADSNRDLYLIIMRNLVKDHHWKHKHDDDYSHNEHGEGEN